MVPAKAQRKGRAKVPRRKAENGRGFPLRLCTFAGDSLLRLAIHVVHHAGVIVCEEKGIFAEAEDVGGAAVDPGAVEEAGDEVFHVAPG